MAFFPTQSMNEMRSDGRPSVEKSHSFGGYGPQTQTRIVRGDSVTSTKSAVLNKQDSNQQTWRLSPSSSGCVQHLDNHLLSHVHILYFQCVSKFQV